MVRVMLGMNRRDRDDLIQDHIRTRHAANLFAQKSWGKTFTGHLIGQTYRKWEGWLSRGGGTHIRRLMAWQSAAFEDWRRGLLRNLRLERKPWHRRRRGQA